MPQFYIGYRLVGRTDFVTTVEITADSSEAAGRIVQRELTEKPDEPFLWLRITDDNSVLIAKAQITEIRINPASPETRRPLISRGPLDSPTA